METDRAAILQAWILLGKIVTDFDPGDSDTTDADIEAAIHRVILMAEHIRGMVG